MKLAAWKHREPLSSLNHDASPFLARHPSVLSSFAPTSAQRPDFMEPTTWHHQLDFTSEDH